MKETDETLKKNLTNQLFWDNRVDISNIMIDVDNRRVTLTGSVPNYAASEAALLTAWGTRGVIQVNNNLTVEYPTSEEVPPDPEIKSRIETLLSWSKAIYGQDVRVSVDAGVVKLEGTVDAYWKKRKIEELSSHIFGVVKVIDNIVIVPDRDIEDEVIARDIVSALKRRSTEVDKIDIRVEDGKVRLKGTIPDWITQHIIIETVQNTFGVQHINNELDIEA